jgi:mannose-6-phosphate isomerase-like protein (cupin superfamily)
MPVHHGLGPDNRPGWCEVTSAGIFKVSRDGWFDRHYHDFNEYWLVFKGRAKVLTEGREFVVGPGDIVCTHAGDEHDVLEVYEDLEAFWFEERLEGERRLGHLHRSPEAAQGHRVPGAAMEGAERVNG